MPCTSRQQPAKFHGGPKFIPLWNLIAGYIRSAAGGQRHDNLLLNVHPRSSWFLPFVPASCSTSSSFLNVHTIRLFIVIVIFAHSIFTFLSSFFITSSMCSSFMFGPSPTSFLGIQLNTHSSTPNLTARARASPLQ